MHHYPSASLLTGRRKAHPINKPLSRIVQGFAICRCPCSGVAHIKRDSSDSTASRNALRSWEMRAPVRDRTRETLGVAQA
jgi:hypothetical protein